MRIILCMHPEVWAENEAITIWWNFIDEAIISFLCVLIVSQMLYVDAYIMAVLLRRDV